VPTIYYPCKTQQARRLYRHDVYRHARGCLCLRQLMGSKSDSLWVQVDFYNHR
jgi:hypothetical protein